ncbi:hypothetical protein Ae201684_015887 [Aphanomyces euteiches]|uniref:Peptidase A2 domain-containing protein n=1 Tax=Aphanomyces euteiches TaxID=100861 RepID=A0A6G0WEF3_9STRA|nr:hypothetical protein Ae201684_015887 [Aphanomyces euteiches]
MFEVKKPADQMTESDWKNCFLASKVPNDADYAAIETAMRSLSMDLNIKDAESRYMYEEPELCVKLLCKALRPHMFKISVEKELQKERSKTLRSDITSFVDWLVQRLTAFLTFESSLPKSYHDSHEHAKRKPQNQVGAVANSDGKKGRCLKCQSADHKVFKCPKKKVNSKPPVANIPAAATPSQPNKCEEKAPPGGPVCGIVAVYGDSWVEATIDNVKARVTLDTGADFPVISSKFVEVLESEGVDVTISKLAEPRQVISFSNESVVVESEIHFDLLIQTECGELVLRNITAWVCMKLQEQLVDCNLDKEALKLENAANMSCWKQPNKQMPKRLVGITTQVRHIDFNMLKIAIAEDFKREIESLSTALDKERSQNESLSRRVVEMQLKFDEHKARSEALATDNKVVSTAVKSAMTIMMQVGVCIAPRVGPSILLSPLLVRRSVPRVLK